MPPIGGPSGPSRNHPAPQPPSILTSGLGHANPPLHTVPDGRQMDPRFRPDSPTHRNLLARARMGREFGEHMGPTESMGMIEMTREQAAATHLFKQNLEAVDPARTLRNQGEFGQAYRAMGDHMVANTPLHFEQGGQVTVPPRAHLPGTTFIIHSHPPTHPGFPTDGDYYSAYIQSMGGRNGVQGEMVYDVAKDKFYGYQGRLHPETNAPAYHELFNPFDTGPLRPVTESAKPLPDPSTYGLGYIRWPESRPGTPQAG